MARRPKPWFVTIDGTQHNLGLVKKEAFDRFDELMLQPQAARVPSQSFAALAERFLDWVARKRGPDTYEWYRYRLERFVQKYPDLRARDVRPHHVEAWVDDYDYKVYQHLALNPKHTLAEARRAIEQAKKDEAA